MDETLRQLRQAAEASTADALSDRELIGRFLAERDESAFESLVARHGPMVLGLCVHITGDRHTGEEAFQATFLTLARKASSVRDGDRLACWLYAVARRVALEARRLRAKRAEREKVFAELPEVAAPNREPEFGKDWAELLHREVGRLPSKQREAVLLCHLRGRSRAEAAREAGVPEGTISSRLAKGLAQLRRRLAPRDPAKFAGAFAAAVPGGLGAATAGLATLSSAESTIPRGVASLSEGVIRDMFMRKIRTAVLMAGATLGFRSRNRSGCAWTFGGNVPDPGARGGVAWLETRSLELHGTLDLSGTGGTAGAPGGAGGSLTLRAETITLFDDAIIVVAGGTGGDGVAEMPCS